MLIDANELPENSRIDCDVCIAGSGPSGITIASELAGTQMRVCLIESGGLAPQRSVEASNVAEQIGISVDLTKSRRPSLGGASNWWGGLRGRWFRLKPMDPLDFEERPWVPNSGWPLKYEELAPFFKRAGKILKASGDFSVKAHCDQIVSEFHNDDLRTTIFQMSRPLRFGQRYRALLAGSDNIRVYLHGRVIEIEEDANAPVIRYMRMATNSGRIHRISAKYFVLACGGLENTRLLLVSRRKADAGIGNQHDLVGRYYMQHPRGLYGFAILNRKSVRTPLYTGGYPVNDVVIGGGIAFTEEIQRKEQLLNHCIMLRPIFYLSESHASDAYWAAYRAWYAFHDNPGGRSEFLSLASFAASVFKLALKEFRLHTIFNIYNHMEQIPRAENRLDLSDQKDRFHVNQLRINWRIDPSEKASLCRLHELVQTKLVCENVGRFESQLDSRADAWPVSRDSAHHIGTTRMHNDPKRGVTDRDCRVHGVHNLYVSGSSVFPTSGHANPTLTIVGLAIRLAERLKGLFACLPTCLL